MVDIKSYEQLMARKDIDFISECDGFLYVKLYPTEKFDDSIWKVDKATHEVTYMMFPDYVGYIHHRATYLKKPNYET